MPGYFVYIIKSERYNRFYTGYTTDVKRRVKEHNSAGAKSTKPFGPWELIYRERCPDRKTAMKREWHLKHAPGRKEKLEIIRKHGVGKKIRRQAGV